jgi:hypothetical protein
VGSSSIRFTVGVIRAREAVALQQADRLVVRLRIGGGDGAGLAWADFAKRETRTIVHAPRVEAVERYFVKGGVVAGQDTTGEVDYAARTWTSYKIPHRRVFPNPGPGVAQTVPEAMLGSAGAFGSTGDPLNGALAVLSPYTGYGYGALGGTLWTYRVVGPREIDGQRAVELQAEWSKRDLARLRYQNAMTR